MAKAKQKMTANIYININGEDKLWYTIDEDRNVIWFLPKEKSKEIKKRILENVGQAASEYASNHPESSL